MENLDKIFLIEIEHSYQYSFSDFKDQKGIYVPGVKEIPWILDKNEFVIDWQEGDMKQVECNFWKEVASPYFRRIKIHLFSDQILIVPIPVLFSPLQDWELISCLAVLHCSEPEVEYEFYQVGERYGKGENTVVRNSEKLVKSIFCFNERREKLTLEDYAFNLLSSLSEEKLNEKVKQYLLEIEEHKIEEEMDECDNEELDTFKEGESYFRNDFYNDSLDLDQQSPEFWDNL